MKTLLFAAELALFIVCTVQASAEPDQWQAPRTAWGTPDLQGMWSNETLTPFERPVGQADKPFVTAEEALAAASRIQAARARDLKQGPPTTEPPPVGGNVGAYNLVWLDFGSSVVGTGRSSLVIDPADGRVPVRPEAEARRDAARIRSTDDFEFMSPWDRCITRGMPGGMFPAGYNNYYRILQFPDTIVIHYEMIHEARIIPLDGRPRLGTASWNGEPRGRWEQDTLIVETVGYIDGGWIATSGSQGRIKGIPHTSELRVVERFKRVAADTILWQATIEDPTIYTAPWTVEIPLVARRGSRIYEYACHEGNQAVGNILRGARVQEADPAQP
jgi:hypothetical protein